MTSIACAVNGIGCQGSHYILKRRLQCALFLMLRNFANFRCRQNIATVDAHGMLFIGIPRYFVYTFGRYLKV